MLAGDHMDANELTIRLDPKIPNVLDRVPPHEETSATHDLLIG